MQGKADFIPSDRKVEYLSALLRVGFDVLDAGSFVSPRAVPQMADSGAVLGALPESKTEILAIVANERGATEALDHGRPDVLGFPFSISETFQQRNTGGGIEEGWHRLEAIRNAVERRGKSLVVYLSMGFGNPYGDDWSPEIAGQWSHRLHRELGIRSLALSDTVGAADAATVEPVCRSVVEACPDLIVGAHLHGKREDAVELAAAAWRGGVRRFDGALGGFGGCPMAVDDLVGNLPTELLMQSPVSWGGEQRDWDDAALSEAHQWQSQWM
jgi:hydroxymethylglutaryl-CoA lyase